MGRRKKEEKSMLEHCSEALDNLEIVKSQFPNVRIGNKTATRANFLAVRALEELYKGSYRNQALNRVGEALMKQLKEDIIAILLEESKIDEKEKNVLGKLAPVKPIADKMIKASSPQNISVAITIEETELLLQALEQVKKSLSEEIDLTKAQEALATRVRQLARKLEKED